MLFCAGSQVLSPESGTSSEVARGATLGGTSMASTANGGKVPPKGATKRTTARLWRAVTQLAIIKLTLRNGEFIVECA